MADHSKTPRRKYRILNKAWVASTLVPCLARAFNTCLPETYTFKQEIARANTQARKDLDRHAAKFTGLLELNAYFRGILYAVIAPWDKVMLPGRIRWVLDTPVALATYFIRLHLLHGTFELLKLVQPRGYEYQYEDRNGTRVWVVEPNKVPAKDGKYPDPKAAMAPRTSPYYPIKYRSVDVAAGSDD